MNARSRRSEARKLLNANAGLRALWVTDRFPLLGWWGVPLRAFQPRSARTCGTPLPAARTAAPHGEPRGSAPPPLLGVPRAHPRLPALPERRQLAAGRAAPEPRGARGPERGNGAGAGEPRAARRSRSEERSAPSSRCAGTPCAGAGGVGGDMGNKMINNCSKKKKIQPYTKAPQGGEDRRARHRSRRGNLRYPWAPRPAPHEPEETRTARTQIPRWEGVAYPQCCGGHWN